jgi:hypothetical protein
MNFEDRLRASLKSAGEATPGRPLDWSATLDRARRSRRRYLATVALAAAVFAAAAAASVAALTGDSGGPFRGLPPAGRTATESPTPDTTTSPRPSDTPTPPRETPTPDPDATPPTEPCSSRGMTATPVQQDGLPLEVADTRRRILELAVECDYEGLEALALEGREFFSFSFGGGTSPAQYWRRAEKGGEPVMRNLVTVMNIDYKRAEGFDDIERLFAWPSASYDPTGEDWQKLIDSGLMTSEEVQGMKEVGYIGWRAQITNDGDWITFIAGD